MRVGDVELDSLWAKLRVDGKVGEDTARIYASIPKLALWLDNHPERSNPRPPLWISIGHGKVRQMSYAAARKRFREAVKRAGITRRVWFYLYRHTRYAPTIHGLTEQEQNIVFGWKDGSKAKKAYLHLADEDLDQSFAKMNGLQTTSNRDSGMPVYAPIVCGRCKNNNSPDSKCCSACGLAFDMKYAIRSDEKDKGIEQKVDGLSAELKKSPEVLDMLLNAVEFLKLEKCAVAQS